MARGGSGSKKRSRPVVDYYASDEEDVSPDDHQQEEEEEQPEEQAPIRQYPSSFSTAEEVEEALGSAVRIEEVGVVIINSARFLATNLPDSDKRAYAAALKRMVENSNDICSVDFGEKLITDTVGRIFVNDGGIDRMLFSTKKQLVPVVWFFVKQVARSINEPAEHGLGILDAPQQHTLLTLLISGLVSLMKDGRRVDQLLDKFAKHQLSSVRAMQTKSKKNKVVVDNLFHVDLRVVELLCAFVATVSRKDVKTIQTELEDLIVSKTDAVNDKCFMYDAFVKDIGSFRIPKMVMDNMSLHRATIRTLGGGPNCHDAPNVPNVPDGTNAPTVPPAKAKAVVDDSSDRQDNKRVKRTERDVLLQETLMQVCANEFFKNTVADYSEVLLKDCMNMIANASSKRAVYTTLMLVTETALVLARGPRVGGSGTFSSKKKDVAFGNAGGNSANGPMLMMEGGGGDTM